MSAPGISSPAEWRSWVEGFERGIQTGYAVGYDDALRVLDEAGAFLATLEPSRAFEVTSARRALQSGIADPEPLAVRHRRVAQSWGLTP